MSDAALDLEKITVAGPELGDLLGIDSRTVRRLAVEGHLVKSSRGRYLLGGSIRGFVSYRRGISVTEDASGSEYGVERVRLARARATKQELDNRRMTDELIPRGEVETMLVMLAGGVSQRLQSVPAAAAPVAHASGSIAEVEEVMRSHINEALNELADAAERVGAAG